MGQNGNDLKTDKNGNRTEIKRERNGNGTELPVPLYGREMGTFFDAYRTSSGSNEQAAIHVNTTICT